MEQFQLALETFLFPHLLGGIYGQILGDAWGAAAYLRPDITWSYYEGWIDRLSPAPPDHPLFAGLQAGQVTDNTHQALSLAQALIDSGGEITVEGVTEGLLGWYNQPEDDPFIPAGGVITRQALRDLQAGADPLSVGLRGHNSGAAARISPIGLIHPGQPELTVKKVVAACTPTHFTDVAISGACAIAAAVAQALTPDTTLEDIVAVAVQGAETGLRYGSPWMGASVARKIDYAIQVATEGGLSEQDRLQNLYDLVGATPAAADAVPCAFGILAIGHGSPIETAIYATALSGEAPTIGAMACAIAGAWQGAEAIPPDCLETLRRANPQYQFEEIAEELYEIARHNYHSAVPKLDQDLLDSLQ